jgi:hypothetical protein
MPNLGEGRRRRPATLENAGGCQRRFAGMGNIQQSNFWSRQRDRGRHERRGALQTVQPGCVLIGGCLSHRALADGRVLHLGAHGVQIVGGGDDREQKNQRAAEREETLPRAGAARLHSSPPQPIPWQGQQEPREIQQKFHCAKLAGGGIDRSVPEIANSSQHDQRTDRGLRLTVKGTE